MATSMVGAPSARFNHTAIWTGSEMIVWGGFDNNSPMNTGGRYVPGGYPGFSNTSVNQYIYLFRKQ